MTLQTTPPVDALTMVATKLNAGGYQWMLVGSVAALLYGRNRSTNDIDIVLDCAGIDPVRLARAFEPEFMLDEQMVRDSVARGTMFNAIPYRGGVKVDLNPLSNDPFETTAFDRRVELDWFGTAVCVTQPDDLVIAKLRWARASGSERQLADVRAIMALGLISEDAPYFRRWIRQLGLGPTLDASHSIGYDA